MSHGRQVLYAVALGGAVGALLRAVVNLSLFTGAGPAAFPWSILGINALGSALLGALTVATVSLSVAWWVKPFLGTGVLGGFTTFSAYVSGAVLLDRGGASSTALLYVALTPLICVAAASIGAHAPRLLGLPYGHAPLAREQE